MQKFKLATLNVLLYTRSGAKCTYDTLAFSWRFVNVNYRFSMANFRRSLTQLGRGQLAANDTNKSLNCSIFESTESLSFENVKKHQLDQLYPKCSSVIPRDQCQPGDHLVFVKTHKTGSTTLQLILQIYGYSRNISYLVEMFSRNRQEEENTITFRLKCIVIA